MNYENTEPVYPQTLKKDDLIWLDNQVWILSDDAKKSARWGTVTIEVSPLYFNDENLCAEFKWLDADEAVIKLKQ